MYNKDYNVIEYAVDSVFDRHIFLKSFERPTLNDNPTDCYESVFRHSDEIKHYHDTHIDPVTKKGKVAGYKGAVWADRLILDIDNEADLESARSEISKLLKHLESEYSIDLKWLRINFSGQKGFHVFIPAELFGGFEASEELPEQLKRIGEKLTEGFKFDFIFYHHTGLIRLENTKHSTSGKYAVPLTTDELFTLSIDEIKELASSPRYLDTFDATQLNPISELVKLKDEIEDENDDDDIKEADNTRAKRFQELWQGQSAGNRHKHVSKIIGHLVYKNMPNESIREIVKYWNEHNTPPHSVEEIEKEIKEGIKNFKISPGKFWVIKRNVNGVYKSEINFYDLIEFLEKEGYAKKYLDESYLFIKSEKNVVDVVPLEQIKDYLITYIKEFYDKSGFNKRELLNELYSRSGYYFGKKLIECIPSIELNVLRDKKDESNFYFKNGFVTVTKDNGITLHNYPELEGKIWKSQIIERDFNSLNGQQKSVYEKFLFNVAGQSNDRLKTIKSSIGYLLHGYKDSGNAKVIVLVDEKIPDNSSEPNGRTGKSVFGKALSKMKKATRVDGKNFTFTERFTFQEVYLDTKILEFNDVNRKFDFERLFSVTTDDMTVENKSEKPYTLKFEDSPKLLVSTNYTIKGQGASFEDRLFEVEFSDYYNEKHKPKDDFGKLFFDEWDADEWNRFDNFMLECVEFYLREGLVGYKQINLEKRKLIDQTLPEFVEFAEQNIIPSNKYDKKELFNEYILEYGCPSWLTQRKFTGWIDEYAKYNNFDSVHTKSNSVSYVELEKEYSLFD